MPSTPTTHRLVAGLALCALPLLAQAQHCTGSNADENYILGQAEGTASAMHWPTGLVWKRCTEGQTLNADNADQCEGSVTLKRWTDWAGQDRLLPQPFSSQVNWGIGAGITDRLHSGSWRMAYKAELQGIAVGCASNPSINPTVFPGTPFSHAWTGSPLDASQEDAFYVHFSNGAIGTNYPYSSYHTRLVRGGQPFAALIAPADQAALAGTFASFPAFTLASQAGTGQAWGGARITGAGNPAFQVNGGDWVQEAVVKSGDNIVVRLTAPASATLTLHSAQTRGADTTGPGRETITLQTTAAQFNASAVVPRPLNDTGILWSGHASSGNASTCAASHPAGQDCHFGRDTAASLGPLQKTGASANPANGFDYTKIAHDGQPLPASAALGDAPGNWACTRDNVTGLVWEVKTTSGLRDSAFLYTWYDPASPDGDPGAENPADDCHAQGRCDSAKFVQDVNAASLCGAQDWRLPSVQELESLLDMGQPADQAAIDPVYFPNTPLMPFWSRTTFANPTVLGYPAAWAVDFDPAGCPGGVCPLDRVLPTSVRLVRGGQ